MEAAFDGVRVMRGGRPVLDVPQLRLASGRVTAVLGPNGSGKTTLLRALAGLERPSTGVITLGGRRIGSARAASALVAFAFQQAVFVSGTVRENLELGLRLRGVRRDERHERVAAVAAATGIAALLDRRALTLSGGEAQRTNLARALALRAPLTLLDEPTSGLDASARAALLGDLPPLLRSFAGTVVVVTHDREEALALAQDAVVLRDGRVVAAGEASDVLWRPASAAAADVLGFTIVPGESGGRVAIPPGVLRCGPAPADAVQFAMTVASVAAGPHEATVRGTIGGQPAVAFGPTSAAAGDTIRAWAPRDAVVQFADEDDA